MASNLRSKARSRMIEVISEGEIGGLVNGARSIYFDQTPVQNANGSFNFENVIFEEHKGTEDEGYFTGATGVETPVSVEVQVKNDTGPVVRTVLDTNADALRVILRIPALYRQTSKGDMDSSSVEYAIDVRRSGGVWVEIIRNTIKGKTLSPYQVAHRVPLSAGGSPWDVRVRRISDDEDDDGKKQNLTFWEGYVILVEGKFIYPHTAAVSLEVNAEDMGTSIPPRSFKVDGIKCLVPSNYNPVTREYTGIWDGTFKRAVTDCPPWIFYDLITNDRYGMGEFVDIATVDKWTLYTIAQYCDQLVPSGFKNTITGNDIMEPRFTFNGVIGSREDAYFVLQQISTAWRGMAFWSHGMVFASADMPEDPVTILSPANVVDGEFNYSGTAMKARHSVAVVSWNDPADHYRQAKEVVINQAMLNRYGWREKPVELKGCNSRGLAHRYGKWILDVEQNETETVEFTVSWDHAQVRPGNIIAIADTRKAQIRHGGRIVSHEDTQIVLDMEFDATPGETYSLILTMPDGTIDAKSIESFDKNVVTVAEAYEQTALVDAMFVITGSDIVPRQYRVLAVDETEPHRFRITALFHDPQKYDRVEQNVLFDPLPYNRPPNISAPPVNLQAREIAYTQNGETKSRILLSWSPSQSFIPRAFRVGVATPYDGYVTLPDTPENSIILSDVRAGQYVFDVRALNLSGVLSAPATLTFEAVGPEGIPIATVSDIKLADRPESSNFVGRDVSIVWTNNFPDSSDEDSAIVEGISPLYKHNTVKVYDTATNTLLRTQTRTEASFVYTYDMNVADTTAASLNDPSRSLRFVVSVTDTYERTSVEEEEIFSNPVPGAITPLYTVNGSNILFGFTGTTEADFAGILVWRSTTSDFDPEEDTPIYDITSNTLVVPGDPDTDYYFRFAAYDSFGKTGLNISSELHLQTQANGADLDPPAVPTGLELSTELDDDTSAAFVKLTAVWEANTEDDFAYYVLELKEGTGAWVAFQTSALTHEVSVRAGRSFSARLYAVDKAGNKSDPTDTETITSATDAIAPAEPTEFDVNPGLDAIWLTWTPPSDADLSHIVVFESETEDEEDAVEIARVIGRSFARTGLALEETRSYWIKAVDTSGNESDLVGPETATTGSLPEQPITTVDGIVFTPNDTPDRLEWSSGSISYGLPGEAPTTKAIDAGYVDWTSGSIYVYYGQGNTALSTTSNLATIYGSSGTLLGIYKGGTSFQLVDGSALIDGNTIIAGTIGAAQLVTGDAVITGAAQIADAIIGDAHIDELSASKLTAGSAIAGSILVGDKSFDDIILDAELGAEDPAGRINDGATQIDPGKIVISGGSTLADWRRGGDETMIDGEQISAGTVKANVLEIGLRMLSFEGLTFEHNSPSINQVAWTSGTIRYPGDDGNLASRTISASGATWSSGTLYLYWVKGATAISSTTDISVAMDSDNVVLAAYTGGTNLVTEYGRTIIDGSNIKTGSIDTNQIKANAITSGLIAAGAIQTEHLDAGVVTADKIDAGAIETDHLAADAVTADKINVVSLDAISATLGSLIVVGTSNLDFDAVTEKAIQTGNVTFTGPTAVNGVEYAEAFSITANPTKTTLVRAVGALRATRTAGSNGIGMSIMVTNESAGTILHAGLITTANSSLLTTVDVFMMDPTPVSGVNVYKLWVGRWRASADITATWGLEEYGGSPIFQALWWKR